MTPARLIPSLVLLALLIGGAAVATAASSSGVGTPSMQLTCGDDSLTPGTATVFVRGLGVTDEGAAGFNAMVLYDHDVMTLQSYVGGQGFLNLPGCSYSPSSPVAPGTGGTYDYLSGACTTIPPTGVLGDVFLAKLTFIKKDGAPGGIYPIELVTGEPQFGVPYTAIYDSSPEADTSYLSQSSLSGGEARFGTPCSVPETPHVNYLVLILRSGQTSFSQPGAPSHYLPLLFKPD